MSGRKKRCEENSSLSRIIGYLVKCLRGQDALGYGVETLKVGLRRCRKGISGTCEGMTRMNMRS